MKPILDATAGNRAMHKDKNPQNLVFMDKEMGLSTPPHLFATWQKLPFRDNVFSKVLFDPPHSKFGRNSVHNNPQGWANPRIVDGRKIGGTWWGSLETGWIGVFFKAQKEFARVSDILCFKWNTTSHSLEKVLIVFEEWIEYHRENPESRMQRGKSKTWWVTMSRKETKKRIK